MKREMKPLLLWHEKGDNYEVKIHQIAPRMCQITRRWKVETYTLKPKICRDNEIKRIRKGID